MKITIVTPTWKRDPRIVKRCLGCVQYQTHSDWEHLICSDGEEEEHIKTLTEQNSDSRRSYYNLGSSYNELWDSGNTVRRRMIERATGDAICFYDDDNIIMPYYLERLSAALESSPQSGFAVCRVIHFGPVQPFVGDPPLVLTGVPPKLYFIDSLQVLVRTDVIRDIGWIENDGPYVADGTTFESMAKKYGWVEVPEILGIHI